MKNEAVKIRGKVTHVGMAAAAALLELWMDRKLELSEEEYDSLVDAVIELLGATRDEQWRFAIGRTSTTDDDPVK